MNSSLKSSSNGVAATTGTDPAQSNIQAQVIKVTENVYVAVGFALANIIMIEGNDGIILVDTTENEEIALKILEEFRKITNKPIKGIVLTHFHGVDNFDCKQFGVARQFGLFLGDKASALNVGEKLPRFVEPTDTFDDKLDVDLAGVNFTLIHAPGETRDHINVWIPDLRMAITGDNIAQAFPNISSIRGTPARDPEEWIESLDKIRLLRPEHLVPCHLFPISGEKKVYDIMTTFRDAIQFVHDQTLRYLNDGYELDNIVEKVRLPPTLATHPYLQELYGTVEWSVRGIIQLYLGWFDRHPMNLFPLTKQERAERWRKLLDRQFDGNPSGIEKMLIVAEAGLDVHNSSSIQNLWNDLQWSLELLSHVLKVAKPDSPPYKQAMNHAIKCLSKLADLTVCPNGKRYYLAVANELPTNQIKNLTLQSRFARIQQWPIEFSMKRIKYSFRAEACSDREKMSIIFEFPDVAQSHSYTMRHCILEYFDNPQFFPKEHEVKIKAKSTVLKDLLTGKASTSSAQESGDLAIDGPVNLFERFLQLVEMSPRMHSDMQPILKSVM